MAARAIRKRLSNSDTGERKEENMDTSISETLRESLVPDDFSVVDPKRYDIKVWRDNWDAKRKECFNCTYLLSKLITQLARKISSIFTGFVSLLRKFYTSFTNQRVTNIDGYSIVLSPLQEERLQSLRLRLEVPFDGSSVDHQDALKQLWRLAYPNRELPSLKSDLWKEMGWQGPDPSTDFRGGGFISLENLIYFAKTYPDSFQRLLHKTDGKRSEWEYPFAVAGINISYMLIKMLDLQSEEPNSRAGSRFLELLADDGLAFDNLYCVAFQLLDTQWLAKGAGYMEFNEILKSTRFQLEQELASEGISCIKDMPAYKMLDR